MKERALPYFEKKKLLLAAGVFILLFLIYHFFIPASFSQAETIVILVFTFAAFFGASKLSLFLPHRYSLFFFSLFFLQNRTAL